MKQIGKNLKVISYTQAFKRSKKLNLESDNHRIDKDDLRNIQITVGSTKVNIYNNKVVIVNLIFGKENIMVTIKSGN